MTQRADKSLKPSSIAANADEASTGTGTVAVEEIDVAATEIRSIGPYQLEEQIGRGAMGAVYRAEHTRLKRKVALKVLPSELAISDNRLRRFQREMEAVGRLDHPNIVRATDAGDENGVHYLVMELVDGLDLAQILDRRGPLDVGSASEIVRQVATGLAHIADNRLVHRDIKPSNLILTQSGDVKILDLGIAMLHEEEADTRATATGVTIGTPDYIAPEQIDGASDVDIRADIYSLGCTFYNLLAGAPPFSGPDSSTRVAKLIAQVTQTPPPINTRRPDVPREILQVIDRMMAKRPCDRQQSLDDIIQALEPWADRSALCDLLDDSSAAHRLPVAAKQTGSSSVVRRISRTIAARDNHQRTILVCLSLTVVTLLLVMGGSKFSSDADRVPPLVPTSTLNVAHGTASNVSRHIDSTLLREIAADTADIRARSTTLTASQQRIGQDTQQIAESLDELRKTFNAAIQSNQIVVRPTSAGQLYHNARLHETMGRHQEAGDCYRAMIDAGAEFVDVHQRYQSLCKLRFGLATTRTLYSTLRPSSKPSMRAYAVALLHEGADRRERLERIVDQDPGFAPAQYELSQVSSSRDQGVRTFNDQRDEKRRLQHFFDCLEDTAWGDYFLDQSAAGQMLDDAIDRRAAVESFDLSAAADPVEIVFTRTRRAWQLQFHVKERAREIFYRLSPDSDYTSTGTSGHDPTTQLPAPVTSASMSLRTGACEIEVVYVDAKGARRGPYRISFHPESALIAHAKRILKLQPQTWASYLPDPHDAVSFAYLAKFHGAVDQVRYGVDQPHPSKTLALSDSTTATNAARVIVDVPSKSEYVVVQLRFADGTASELVTIER